MELKNRRLRQQFVYAFSVMSFTSTACALDYTLGYNLPFEIEYNSNIQMVEDNEESVTLYKFLPRFTFIARDELNTYRVNGGLLAQRSSNSTVSEDRDDPNLGLFWNRDFDKGSFSLSTDYAKSSTRTTELTQSGLVFSDGSAVARSYNANLSYTISDKLNSVSGVGYRQTRYSASTLSDYSSRFFNTRLNYLYSEKLSPFVAYSINSYQNDGSTTSVIANNSGNSISQDYSVGFVYQVNPRLNFDAAAGVNHINSLGSQWVGSTGLNWSIDDNSTLNTKLAREVSASGLGGFQKSDRFSARYVRQLNQKDSIGTDATWVKNRSINQSESQELGAWYSRNLSENWDFRTHASYRNLQNSNLDANGYIVGISFEYNKPNF
ncbi:MAG: hypothetical protein ACXW1T_08950 [Methylophilus sp.]